MADKKKNKIISTYGEKPVMEFKTEDTFLTNQPIAYIMLDGQTRELCQEKGQ